MNPQGTETNRSAAGPAARTGFVYDKRYLEHLAGPTGHPERPERLTAIVEELRQTGLLQSLDQLTPRSATEEELALAHDPSYVALVNREASQVRGLQMLSTGDTLLSAASLEVARLAAGGVLVAADAVMRGEVRNVFCAVRPPGHHATRDHGMGFCIFNNVAVAARYLQKKHGIRRALIVDWDYHHGNGTQDIFYSDGTVFYFSTHEYGVYPGTGHPAETGEGSGRGTTLNVPLPAGASDEQILRALEAHLVPAAQQFRPEFVLVSAGFDPMREDLLGRFDVTPAGFAKMTLLVRQLAEQLCGGRLVSVLEGGYRLDGLAASVAAHLRALEQK